MLYLDFPSWLKPELIPNFPLRWYAVMYLVAFGITYLLFTYQIKKRKLQVKEDDVFSFFFWGIVGLLLGARLFATTIYDTTGQYLSQPWLIFWPFDSDWKFTGLAGMSYHGGLVGVVVAAFLYARSKKIQLLDWADMLVYAAPLGYTFGRLGNFINGELWGRVSDAPWAVLFEHSPQLSLAESWVKEMAAKTGVAIVEGAGVVNLPRHPSQIYEAIFEGVVLWLVLWFIARPRRRFAGQGVSQYLIGYGLARFAIEYFREPDKGLDYVIALGDPQAPTELFTSVLNISMGQILSFLMILAGFILYGVLQQRYTKLQAERDFTIHETAQAPKKAIKPKKKRR